MAKAPAVWSGLFRKYIGGMKCLLYLLLITGLASCGASDADPTHAAVSDYLKKNMDDPSSYEPVRFAKAERFTRSDSAYAAAAKLIKSNIRQERELGYALTERDGKDTTRLGMRVVHAFRGKNKLGATVLDSAQFIVYKDGKVAAF